MLEMFGGFILAGLLLGGIASLFPSLMNGIDFTGENERRRR